MSFYSCEGVSCPNLFISKYMYMNSFIAWLKTRLWTQFALDLDMHPHGLKRELVANKDKTLMLADRSIPFNLARSIWSWPHELIVITRPIELSSDSTSILSLYDPMGE